MDEVFGDPYDLALDLVGIHPLVLGKNAGLVLKVYGAEESILGIDYIGLSLESKLPVAYC